MLWILDAGHGVETPGKRSPGKKSPRDGRTGIVEYEFNRDVVAQLAAALDSTGRDYHIVCQDEHTMALSDRVKIANTMIAAWEGRAALISIHANAAGGRGWSGARGFRVFHHHAPDLARMMKLNVQLAMSEWSRGARVKTSGFTMIKRPKCPSILTENGFMTSKKDAVMLQSPETRARIAEYHFNTVLDYEAIYG